MEQDQFTRTRMVIGDAGLTVLQKARVAVFGIGGVGGCVCDALVRSGLLAIDLFDNDTVSVTNINRQLIALHSTIGRGKVEVMAEHLHDISPECEVGQYRMFYLPETADSVDLSRYDYVVDAVDTVTAKLELITRCNALGIPVISAMGAGNKLDPGQLRITDIYKTETDPLARVIRLECRRRGVRCLKAAWSTEPPTHPQAASGEPPAEGKPRRDTPGSMAFVPSAMGLMIASEVVRDLLKKESVQG